MKNRTVIFLDIDGVVNTHAYLKEQVRDTGTHDSKLWCPQACRNLSFLIRTMKAKIVVSSSWRIGASVEELRKVFASNGIDPAAIIGKTPDVASAPEVWEHAEGEKYCRGYEIEEWLLANDPDCDYLIIDDDADMLNKHKPRFVQVDSENGFADFKAFNKSVYILSNGSSL